MSSGLPVRRFQLRERYAAASKLIPGLAPEDQPKSKKNILPEKYRVCSTSGLEAEVTEKRPNEFVFRLESSSPATKADR